MYRLAPKTALASGLGAAAILLLVRSFGLIFELQTIAMLAGAAMVASYAVVEVVIVRRLRRVRRELLNIREHRFSESAPAGTSRGDEVDNLLWEAYRTGLAVEKEIQDLRRMESYRREFIGNVSHELKTPIFAVQGFAETLLDGAVDDDRVRRAFIEKILRNATRLNKLVSDLAEISRIEMGEVRLQRVPFSLDRLIQEIVESLEVQAREKEVTLGWDVAAGVPHVHADREAVRQVLSNLVDNGIKYTNRGGMVEIVARKSDENNVVISVVDDGVGVATEDIPRLTERFYRVDKSRSREQGGTGLGLSIVKHLLALHERKLSIASSPGRGSTFSFSLPPARGDRKSLASSSPYPSRPAGT